jgi:hypothetical protein
MSSQSFKVISVFLSQPKDKAISIVKIFSSVGKLTQLMLSHCVFVNPKFSSSLLNLLPIQILTKFKLLPKESEDIVATDLGI